MRQALLQEVATTGNTLQQLLSAFSDEQLNTVPFDGSWTAAQVASHICKAGNCSHLYGAVKASDRQPDEKVPAVKSMFLNFDTKMKSPQSILPDGGHLPKDKLLKDATIVWDKLTDAASTLDLTEECTSFEVPGFGPFTRFEWVAFITTHTQRHIHQMQRIYDAVVKA